VIRYLLFDVDDTLYPRSSPIWPLLLSRIIGYMVERMGMTRPEAEALRARYLKEYGTTTRGLYLHNHLDIHDYLQYVHDMPLNTILQRDDALNAALAQIPVEKCLFTNASRQHGRNVVEALGISHHFTRTFGLEDFEFISKPDPHGYRIALAQLGANGTECMMIEDSARNLVTAKELGMTTVLVDETLPAPSAVVDYVIARVHDIVRVWHILSQNGQA
jgi:putative hydrolase of the HAD superfamily